MLEHRARSRTRGMKRPKELEIDCMREEMQRAASGLVVPVAIFFVQIFVPERRGVIVPNIACVLILVTLQLSTMYLLKTHHGYTKTKRAHQLNSAIHHAGRTCGHISWIVSSNEDLFGRLFFLFLAPCSATRHSRHSTFIAYLVVHVILMGYRFSGTFAEDYPFMIASAGCCHILYEISVLKQKGEESALEKSRLMVTLTEDIAEAVLECFCDATARLSDNLEILQDSTSLSTLLSRRVCAGRKFTDFVHMGDREEYREFINQAPSEDSAGNGAEMDYVKNLRLRSTDLHLEDSMNIPIEAHIFHARLTDMDENPFYLIGVSERESYNIQTKKSKTSAAASARRAKDKANLPSIDFESGKLNPSRPAFKKKDMETMRDLETLRHGSGSSEAEKAEGPPGARRAGSPRPEACSRLKDRAASRERQ